MSGNQLQQLVREIKRCSSSRDLIRCRAVHAEVLSSDHCKDRYLSNLLIDMYGKSGSAEQSKSVFDSTIDRNIFSWNMLLSAFAQNRDLQQATTFFYRFPQHDIVSWNSILQVFVQRETRTAIETFMAMPQRDMVSWNTLLQADDLEAMSIFSRSPCHSVRSATAMITIFSEKNHLDQAKLQFDSMPERDSIAWNAMVHAFAENGHLQFALEGFEKIPQRNAFSCNVTLGVLLEQGDFKFCSALFYSMPDRSPVSWTTMMSACAREGHMQKCKQLFDSMPDRNIVAWTVLLDSCSVNGLPDQAKNVFQKMPCHDEISFSSILSTYARGGYREEAQQIYEAMPNTALSSLNVLVQAYAQSGHFDKSQEILRLGCLQGTDPNEKTFIGLLAGLSYSGKLVEGARCFNSMVSDFHLNPWIEHYCCMVHLLGRANRAEEAEELINTMPYNASGVEWTSLLDSCRLHGDTGLARVAAEKAFEAQPRHGGFYPLLSELTATVTGV